MKIATAGRSVSICANERCGQTFTRQRGVAQYRDSGHNTGLSLLPDLREGASRAEATRRRRAERDQGTLMPRHQADPRRSRRWPHLLARGGVGHHRRRAQAGPQDVRHPRGSRTVLRTVKAMTSFPGQGHVRRLGRPLAGTQGAGGTPEHHGRLPQRPVAPARKPSAICVSRTSPRKTLSA